MCGLLIGILLVSAGVTSTYLGLVRPLADVLTAKTWQEGSLVSGRAEVLPFHGITHADFTYICEHDGHRVAGKRYSFVHPTAFLDEETLSQMQRGLGRVCYVDPSNANRVVISRDVPWTAYRYSGVLMLVAGGLMLWWIRLLHHDFARAAISARALVRLAGALLVGWAVIPLVWSSSVTQVLVIGVGLLAPGLALLWLAPWALRATSVWFFTLSLLGPCFGLNPFALMDMPTDDLHDPGFVAEYVVNCFAFTFGAWAVALLATTVATHSETVAKLLPRTQSPLND